MRWLSILMLVLAACSGKKDFGFREMSADELFQRKFDHWVAVSRRMNGPTCESALKYMMEYINAHDEELRQLEKEVARREAMDFNKNPEVLRAMEIFREKMHPILERDARFGLSCPSQSRALHQHLDI